ncbi:unnamed protein product [Echinostoma caproni]|uniref:DDE-1 domain-containing protein n=1 Tax=Echinostoma caproni TaxID=27848 RepID=A0A183BH87_9TREM|nr:unnamed protein product [Echinostoma caproni]
MKDIIVKNHIARFGVPVASQALKYCKRGKRIRAGWQNAVGRTTPSKMTVSTFRKEFRTSCVLCLQESWLNDDVDDSEIQLDNSVS